jgi:membrane protease YdiL (CAAX protease family)
VPFLPAFGVLGPALAPAASTGVARREKALTPLHLGWSELMFSGLGVDFNGEQPAVSNCGLFTRSILKENRMKRSLFAERHPYWFVTILEIVVIFVYLLAGTIAHFLNLSNLGLYALANLGLTIIVAALLTVMGWWKATGFRSPDRRGDLLYFLVPFIPMIINFVPGVEVTSLRQLTQILAITLMVGFVEEAVFRGLMLNALKTHGPWKAAIITALLFGLTHALNVLTGKNIVEDAAQIFYALAIGFAYAALVLQKGILWPLVLAHFLIDFVNFIRRPGFTYSPFWEVFIVVSMAVVFTAYGFFVMLQTYQAAEPPL